MKDEDGRVLIKGFYDGIAFDDQAARVMAAVPDVTAEINDRLQIAAEEKVGKNYQESMQYPSLNIRGLKAAVVGKGAARSYRSRPLPNLASGSCLKPTEKE
jgi:hypothetical protein